MDKKKDKDPMEWEVLESEYLYKRPWLTARREHVRLPTGAEIQDFYVLEYPEFCNVIAITKDGRFLMERQYRHAQQKPEAKRLRTCQNVQRLIHAVRRTPFGQWCQNQGRPLPGFLERAAPCFLPFLPEMPVSLRGTGVSVPALCTHRAGVLL